MMVIILYNKYYDMIDKRMSSSSSSSSSSKLMVYTRLTNYLIQDFCLLYLFRFLHTSYLKEAVGSLVLIQD